MKTTGPTVAEGDWKSRVAEEPHALAKAGKQEEPWKRRDRAGGRPGAGRAGAAQETQCDAPATSHSLHPDGSSKLRAAKSGIKIPDSYVPPCFMSGV